MQSGIGMLLKSLGLDEKKMQEVAGAVLEISERLKRIEEKQDQVLRAVRELGFEPLPVVHEAHAAQEASNGERTGN